MKIMNQNNSFFSNFTNPFSFSFLQRFGFFSWFFKLFTNLIFALFLLALIAGFSSIGSILEQDESILFYQQNYPSERKIYGFIDWKLILSCGFDHLYTTWWFESLLFLLAISLISCTITRQFPLFLTSKKYSFKKEKKSFFSLPFFVKFTTPLYFKEFLLFKLQTLNFYLYQKEKVIYGYKGLIGRISPILVHFSLLIILSGSFLGACQNFQAQEFVPKGELFHIQNPIKSGFFTPLPPITIRVNDFWVEYSNEKIHQFYSNLSILNEYGEEQKQQTISVNHPLKYKQVDFYQSDWNLLGIRIHSHEKNENNKKMSEQIFERPFFSFKKNTKSWITWIQKDEKENQNKNIEKEIYTLFFNQFQNTFSIYNQTGELIGFKTVGDSLSPNIKIIDVLSATGILIKYDPSIVFIYTGFGLLMVTTSLSFLPFTQLWIISFSKKEKQFSWVGCTTNRGKINIEIEFENFLRFLEQKGKKTLQTFF
jgi:cytochrome c biogenesis protein